MSKAVTRDINFTRWLFRAYLLVLFLVPLPLGSNRPIFWSLLVAASALIMLVWSTGWLLGVAKWPGGMRRARWPLGVLLLFLAWGGLQLLPSGVVPKVFQPAYLVQAFELAGNRAEDSIEALSTFSDEDMQPAVAETSPLELFSTDCQSS